MKHDYIKKDDREEQEEIKEVTGKDRIFLILFCLLSLSLFFICLEARN